MTEAKPKRRWFRFSIRDLLLLTVIAALAVGWWLDHRRITRNAALESMISRDATIVSLQREISVLESSKSVQTQNYIKAQMDFKIAELQKQIDKRHDELLLSLP
jgi:hypothetical protein